MSEILNTSAVIFNVGWRALESDAKKQITAWFFNCFIRRNIYDPRAIRSVRFWKMAIILIGVSLDIPDIFVY